MHNRIVLLAAFATLTLAGCAAENPVGRYKVGKPYTIKGETYTPQESYTKTEEGLASWYGPGFQGKKTANGERFDQNAYTAAHPTLQMPSLVRVTNLNNGKSLIVRVNDRGPFHSRRVMDVSKGAAEALGFRNIGTARVKLQVLGPESMALANAAKQGIDTRNAEIAMNDTGKLDDRFTGFFPTLVKAPQPEVMIAAEGYQPGLTVGGAPVASETLVPLPAAPQIVVTDQPVHAIDPIMQAPIPQAAPQAPAAQSSIFQMSPISEANAGELPPQTLGTLTPKRRPTPVYGN